MNIEKSMIDRIPAILYGDSSNKVYLFVHGKLGYKEEAEMQFFDPRHVIPELHVVMQYIHKRWSEVALRANSIGAWFSMLAYENVDLKQCLLVSPILDMKKLIENMMTWAGVTEQNLQEKYRIETTFGETLDWEYYQYAKEKEHMNWSNPTYILYAGKDNLSDRDTVNYFTQQYHCKLSVMEEGEHWFHTKEQLAVLEKWTESILVD